MKNIFTYFKGLVVPVIGLFTSTASYLVFKLTIDVFCISNGGCVVAYISSPIGAISSKMLEFGILIIPLLLIQFIIGIVFTIKLRIILNKIKIENTEVLNVRFLKYKKIISINALVVTILTAMILISLSVQFWGMKYEQSKFHAPYLNSAPCVPGMPGC